MHNDGLYNHFLNATSLSNMHLLPNSRQVYLYFIMNWLEKKCQTIFLALQKTF